MKERKREFAHTRNRTWPPVPRTVRVLLAGVNLETDCEGGLITCYHYTMWAFTSLNFASVTLTNWYQTQKQSSINRPTSQGKRPQLRKSAINRFNRWRQLRKKSIVLPRIQGENVVILWALTTRQGKHSRYRMKRTIKIESLVAHTGNRTRASGVKDL